MTRCWVGNGQVSLLFCPNPIDRLTAYYSPCWVITLSYSPTEAMVSSEPGIDVYLLPVISIFAYQKDG